MLHRKDKTASRSSEADIAALGGTQATKLEKIQALWDVGKPPTIRLLQRGSADAPGPKVTPGFLEMSARPAQTDAARPAETQGQRRGFGSLLRSG